MNINSTSSDNNRNISFRMLHMPSKVEIAKLVGNKMAEQADHARSSITEAAEELNGIADVL